MADLRGRGTKDVPPSVPKFLHFHAVFGKNWPNNRLALPPFGISAPSSEKSWIRDCRGVSKFTMSLYKHFTLRLRCHKRRCVLTLRNDPFTLHLLTWHTPAEIAVVLPRISHIERGTLLKAPKHDISLLPTLLSSFSPHWISQSWNNKDL